MLYSSLGSLGVPCLCCLLLFPFESWILGLVGPTPCPWEWWDARLRSCGRRARERPWMTLSSPPEVRSVPFLLLAPCLVGPPRLRLLSPSCGSARSPTARVGGPFLREWNGDQLKGPGVILSLLPPHTSGSCEKLRPGCPRRSLHTSASLSPTSSQRPSSCLGSTLR